MSEQIKGSTFEELYLQQRKKSQMLLVAVIILAVVAAGSLAWGFSKDGSQNQADTGNFPQGQGFNGQGSPGGGPGGGMGMDIKSFFKDDGSVDTERIEQMTSRMPSGGSRGSFNIADMIKQQADQAVEDGDITQAQADALIKAFESESSTNES